MITKEDIDIAYCFFHQKERVYVYSMMDWQRDDIEVAIADYADQMNPELYAHLSGGRTDFLRDHTRFADDIRQAVETLERML